MGATIKMMPRRGQQEYIYRHGACGHYYIPIGPAFPPPQERPLSAPSSRGLPGPGASRSPPRVFRPKTAKRHTAWGGGTYGTTWDPRTRTLTRSCLPKEGCLFNTPGDTHIQDLADTRWRTRTRWQHDPGRPY